MKNDDKGMILQRFVENCQMLRIDSCIWKKAIQKFHKLNADGVLSSDADEWLCCSLYSELQHTKMRDMRQEDDTCKSDDLEQWEKKSLCHSWNISLTKLLRRFTININKFLKRMQHWNWLAQNPEVFQQEIIDMERRIGITLLLLHHYQRIFSQLYVDPKSTKTEDTYQMIYEFGWLLFLVVRNELPSFATTNLVNGCQLLVCALELVYINALEVHKSKVINTTFEGVPHGWTSDDFDIDFLNNYCAIDAICTLIPELPSDGAHSMKNAFFKKAVMGLFMDQRLLGNDRVMRELIKDGILEVNLVSLNRTYTSHVADISEFDERVFLKHLMSDSPVMEVLHKEEKQKTFTNGECRKIISQLTNATQRDNLTKLLDNELPQALPDYISAALGTNFVHILENSLNEMCCKFEAEASLSQESAECRSELFKGLYYILLDRIIGAEMRQKPKIIIGQMLKQLQHTFNSAIIVCCMELMLYIFEIQDVFQRFAWLLKYFDLDAYEFHKIIELVVRHENGLLTRDLIKHLQDVESHFLTSLIWKNNSEIWRIFDGCGLPRYCDIQYRPGPDQENVGSTYGSVNICMRKFYNLANRRLAHLCKCLALLSSYSQIWHIVEHSIIVHGRKLLQDRHVDQLLMCAIYLCVRKAHMRISFSEIIQQYRRQMYAQSTIYRAVHMGDGQPDADIIKFYNEVYVPLMAEYAIEAQCEHSRGKESVSGSRVLQDLSGNKCLRSNMNVFVSPVALPHICIANSCKAKIVTKTATTKNLKRAHSNRELSNATNRPNILRRRTTLR